MALEITNDNFQSEVIDSGQVTLLDFWAEWCGPCKAIGPIVDELSQEYDGQAVIGKVNVDENPDISAKYGVRNIPTLLFIKDGEVVDKQVGAASKAVLEEKLKKHIA